MTERPEETTKELIERKWKLDRTISISTLIALFGFGSVAIGFMNTRLNELATLIVSQKVTDSRLNAVEVQMRDAMKANLSATLETRDEARSNAVESTRLSKELKDALATAPSDRPAGVRLKYACDQLLDAGRNVSRLPQCR